MPTTPLPANPYQLWQVQSAVCVGRGLDGMLRVIVEASYTPRDRLGQGNYVGSLSVRFVDGTHRTVDLSERQLVDLVGSYESGVRIEPDETFDAIAQLIA